MCLYKDIKIFIIVLSSYLGDPPLIMTYLVLQSPFFILLFFSHFMFLFIAFILYGASFYHAILWHRYNCVYVLNWYSLWHPPGISIIDFYFFMIIIGIFVFVVKFRFLIIFSYVMKKFVVLSQQWIFYSDFSTYFLYV